MHKPALPKINVTPLKIVSLAIAGVGILLAGEIQRRETEEYVNKAMDERFGEYPKPPSDD